MGTKSRMWYLRIPATMMTIAPPKRQRGEVPVGTETDPGNGQKARLVRSMTRGSATGTWVLWIPWNNRPKTSSFPNNATGSGVAGTS